MRKSFAWVVAALCASCGPRSSYVRVDDVPLGRVVVYRNGIAYYERSALVQGGALSVRVPRALVDDFLKSLTVFDSATHEPLPVRFPRDAGGGGGGDVIDMSLEVPGHRQAAVTMSYVTEAPAWKPSYRLVIGNDPRKPRVFLEGWAVIDNTSGEDWKDVRIGVGSSSAMSFRYDLWSVHQPEREELKSDERFAAAPPTALSPLPAAGAGNDGAAPQGDAPDGPDAIDLDASGVASSGAAAVENLYTAPGAAGETITIQGAAPAIDEGTTASGSTIDQDYLRNVPSPGRSFDDRVGVAPGTSAGDAAAPSTPGPAAPTPPPPDPRQLARDRVAALGKAAMDRRRAVTITMLARSGAATAEVAAEAKRIHDQLIDVGVPAERVALRAQAGAADGVHVALVPLAEVAPAAAAASDAPIGEERFTAPGVMTVPRHASAMVPILRAETRGEVVYLYDPISARGDARYAFRAVHVVNPTGETLEGGPIAVYGDDHFIGEGLTEQVPPHGAAVVPFAQDREVVVEAKADRAEELRRIVAADRGVMHAEMQDLRTTVLTLQSRLTTPTTVYVLHPTGDGWAPIHEPVAPERIAGALLYPITLAAGARTTVTIVDARPMERDVQLAAPETADLLEAYVKTPAAEPELRAALDRLLALHRAWADRLAGNDVLRAQVAEYRRRQDELLEEVLTLTRAKAGGELLVHLKEKAKEVADKVSALTIAIVDGEQQALIARVRYQDAIAELHLADAATPATAAAP